MRTQEEEERALAEENKRQEKLFELLKDTLIKKILDYER